MRTSNIVNDSSKDTIDANDPNSMHTIYNDETGNVLTYNAQKEHCNVPIIQCNYETSLRSDEEFLSNANTTGTTLFPKDESFVNNGKTFIAKEYNECVKMDHKVQTRHCEKEEEYRYVECIEMELNVQAQNCENESHIVDGCNHVSSKDVVLPVNKQDDDNDDAGYEGNAKLPLHKHFISSASDETINELESYEDTLLDKPGVAFVEAVDINISTQQIEESSHTGNNIFNTSNGISTEGATLIDKQHIQASEGIDCVSRDLQNFVDTINLEFDQERNDFKRFELPVAQIDAAADLRAADVATLQDVELQKKSNSILSFSNCRKAKRFHCLQINQDDTKTHFPTTIKKRATANTVRQPPKKYYVQTILIII